CAGGKGLSGTLERNLYGCSRPRAFQRSLADLARASSRERLESDSGKAETSCTDLGSPLTHPRESHLLPLVERLVEMRERGADRGGGRAHGGKALAHRGHAADRGERGLGGGGGRAAGRRPRAR